MRYVMKSFKEDPEIFWAWHFIIFIPLIVVFSTALIVGQLGISDKIDQPELRYWGVLALIIFVFLWFTISLKQKRQ